MEGCLQKRKNPHKIHNLCCSFLVITDEFLEFILCLLSNCTDITPWPISEVFSMNMVELKKQNKTYYFKHFLLSNCRDSVKMSLKNIKNAAQFYLPQITKVTRLFLQNIYAKFIENLSYTSHTSIHLLTT